MGSGARKPETGGSFLGRRWLWVAGGVFVVVAVLSATGYSPGGRSEPLRSDLTPRYVGKEVQGTRGSDHLRGTSAGELLFAFGASDRVDGGDGSDLIDPGNGEDTVLAGAGDDRIRAYDGDRDTVNCGDGYDLAYIDAFDAVYGCEETIESSDMSMPATPDPPTTAAAPTADRGPAGIVRGTFVLVDQPWVCEGPVDVDLVKVTIHRRTTPLDAVSLSRYCTGRIGRVEIETWSGDGIKVQNAGSVAHDLVIESGSIRCYEKTGAYHQDGIQAMGGRRITFRDMDVNCGRPGVNANLFIAQGGSFASIPTDIVFEGGHLGPNAAHTILVADAVRSGVRDTVICPGRWFTYMTQATAVTPIDEGNVVARANGARCPGVKLR